MSYAAITPQYYQMLQPDGPWHAGAPGWSTAPFPGWGENPNLRGPARLATNGVGGCGCNAVGLDMSPPLSIQEAEQTEPPKPPPPTGKQLGPSNAPLYVASALLAVTAAIFIFKPKFLNA